MGLFGPSKASTERKARAEQNEKRAAEYSRKARKETQEAEKYRKSLRSGKSQDPAADRYMIREHEANRRTAASNAKGFQKAAEFERKRWF